MAGKLNPITQYHRFVIDAPLDLSSDQQTFDRDRDIEVEEHR